MRWRSYIFIVTTIPLFVCGCSHPSSIASDQADQDKVRGQIQPAYANNIIHTAPAAKTDPDPLLSDSEQDPLGSSKSIAGDSLTGSDPLLDDNGSSASSQTAKNRPIKNWYWLKGTISNGSVIIKVNGDPIGQYSVTLDKEISDYLNLGTNEITFDCKPTIEDEPVQCDLYVVYSQQPEGALPVVEYNTADAIPDQTATSLAFTVKKSKFGDPQLAIAPPATSDDMSSTDVTKTVTFSAF